MRDVRGKPCYKRLGFNLVEYDNSPDLFIEPRYLEGLAQDRITVPTVDGNGLVNKFEFVTGEPFSGIHQFD